MYLNLCEKFGKFNFLIKGEPKVSKEFLDSIEFLKWKVKPKEIIIAARFLALACFIVLMILSLLAFFLNFGVLYFLIAALAFPLLLMHFFTEYPKSKAKLKALEALGKAPETLIYLIIPLKQNPNLEEAAKFAAEYGEGEIAKDLKDALWKSWSGKTSSIKEELPKLGLKWGKFSPEFKRSIYLIRSSLVEKSASRRMQILDKSLETALDGMITKTKNYVAALFFPTLLLFSFGTVLPLMFISMLPIISYFGFSFASPLELGLILGATLLAIFIYSNDIISKRPPSFSQSKVPELPELPKKNEMFLFKRRIPGYLFILVFSVVIGFPGLLYLATQSPQLTTLEGTVFESFLANVNTLTLVWGVGLAFAIYCYCSAKPKKKLRDETKEMDAEILDGAYQLANRMAEGRPPEEALGFAADSIPDTKLGNLLEKAAKMIRRRNITLEQAFFDKKIGVMKKVYSRTVRSIIRLFVVSSKKGIKSSSEILFTVINYFSELKKAEKELADLLRKNISMLKATVIFFAPMVSGLVVTLYGIMQQAMVTAQEQLANIGVQGGFVQGFFFFGSVSLSTEILQLIVGFYMLVLGIILIRYISLIEKGPDEVEMKLNIAKSIPLSLVIFTVVLLLSRKMLGG